MDVYAKVIADSTTELGNRLTTFEVCFHRFVLAEFNTHRVFSRNSASSRAIPLRKQLARVRETPALPLSWPAEQKGMQGGAELDDDTRETAEWVWRKAALEATLQAERLGELGVHKSVANRILEPFMMHTVVVTSTAWDNFFAQRCSPLAQPEIREAAEQMREAYDASEPDRLVEGQWHLPYVINDEETDWTRVANGDMAKISAARCARVSYLTQDGVRDIAKDFELYERLVTAKPAHWSPLEHVATPWLANQQRGASLTSFEVDGRSVMVTTDHLPRVGNLLGWRSLRTEVEAVQGEVTFR